MENEIYFHESITDEGDEIVNNSAKRCRLLRQAVQPKKFCPKEERNASIKKVSQILQKSEDERSFDELQMLKECPEAVEEVYERWRKRDEAKRRLEEFEDPIDVLDEKCQLLAQAIAQSQHLVVYTGAGISTAAKIPDYRGPNGIWTRMQQGKEIGDHDLSLAEPTFTHMALSELYRKNILKYVVSQNCDGLHLRSGLPRTALSELHGNMYVEVCKNCKPTKEYWRLFDVTENTARYSHKTSRKCYTCNEPLVDTIVHFGERGSLQWPLNWKGACLNAKKATTILCLGSSLKVLKKYPWLWQMDKPAKKRPNLYIVNLQWTPKDEFANIKINGKCDKVMEIIMDKLGLKVRPYDKHSDPIYEHATGLNDLELHTTTQPLLKLEIKDDLNMVVKEEELEQHRKDDLLVQTNIKDSLKDCINSSNYVDLSKNPVNNTKNSEDCDKSSNRSNISSINQCLPLTKEKPVKSNSNNIFSIDGILNGNTGNQMNNLNTIPHEQTPIFYNNSLFNPGLSLFGYNFLQSQFLASYSDFLLYPYQTSFLYSGLHSIIKPLTNFNDLTTVKTEIQTTVVQQPACDFCDKLFNSLECLFYSKTEPVFINQTFRYSKLEEKKKANVCVCCDYSTDEEDLDDSNTNMILDKDLNDKEQIKNRIQAGWFGKGYKKGRRPKRKSI